MSSAKRKPDSGNATSPSEPATGLDTDHKSKKLKTGQKENEKPESILLDHARVDGCINKMVDLAVSICDYPPDAFCDEIKSSVVAFTAAEYSHPAVRSALFYPDGGFKPKFAKFLFRLTKYLLHEPYSLSFIEWSCPGLSRLYLEDLRRLATVATTENVGAIGNAFSLKEFHLHRLRSTDVIRSNPFLLLLPQTRSFLFASTKISRPNYMDLFDLVPVREIVSPNAWVLDRFRHNGGSDLQEYKSNPGAMHLFARKGYPRPIGLVEWCVEETWNVVSCTAVDLKTSEGFGESFFLERCPIIHEKMSLITNLPPSEALIQLERKDQPMRSKIINAFYNVIPFEHIPVPDWSRALEESPIKLAKLFFSRETDEKRLKELYQEPLRPLLLFKREATFYANEFYTQTRAVLPIGPFPGGVFDLVRMYIGPVSHIIAESFMGESRYQKQLVRIVLAFSHLYTGPG